MTGGAVQTLAATDAVATLRAFTSAGTEWRVTGSADLMAKTWRVIVQGFATGHEEELIGQQDPSSDAPDLDWLSANLEALRRRYAGEWIAAKDGVVVAHAVVLPDVLAATKAAGIDRPFITHIATEPMSRAMAYAHEGF